MKREVGKISSLKLHGQCFNCSLRCGLFSGSFPHSVDWLNLEVRCSDVVKGDPHPPKTLVRQPGYSVSDLLVPAVALSADNGCPGPEGLGRAGPVLPLHVHSSQPLHFVVVLVPLRISEHGPDCRIYSVELHPCRAKVAPPSPAIGHSPALLLSRPAAQTDVCCPSLH